MALPVLPCKTPTVPASKGLRCRPCSELTYRKEACWDVKLTVGIEAAPVITH